MSEYNFVGVDIAKNKFDVALKCGSRFVESVFENNISGFKAFKKWLLKHAVQAWVCLEATGHYGEGVAEFLFHNNIKASVVNPMQIKHHAKSLLTRNKNDKVDARIIASYAEIFRPKGFNPKSSDQKEIKEIARLIEVLEAQKQQLANQLESAQCNSIRKEIKKIIRSIEKRIAELEVKLKSKIANNAESSENKERLISIKGIGEKTADRLIAYLPDVTQFKNAKQFAAYAGLCPRQFQSGQHSGKSRLSKYGDSRLRKTLYMPALVAKRFNPHLQSFCQRLQKNGLKPKAIVCAVMRKLLHIIFGMLKNKQSFNVELA